MTLRKCIFESRIILNGVTGISCQYHHCNYQQAFEIGLQGLFSFQPECATGFRSTILKIGYTKDLVKNSRVSFEVQHALATVVNWLGKNRVTYLNSILDVLMWGMFGNGSLSQNPDFIFYLLVISGCLSCDMKIGIKFCFDKQIA